MKILCPTKNDPFEDFEDIIVLLILKIIAKKRF